MMRSVTSDASYQYYYSETGLGYAAQVHRDREKLSEMSRYRDIGRKYEIRGVTECYRGYTDRYEGEPKCREVYRSAEFRERTRNLTDF